MRAAGSWRRGARPSASPRLAVHVDELVLHDLPATSPERITAAVERGVRDALAEGGADHRDDLGADLARAITRSLDR